MIQFAMNIKIPEMDILRYQCEIWGFPQNTYLAKVVIIVQAEMKISWKQLHIS